MGLLVAAVAGVVQGKTDCLACCDESCMEGVYTNIYYGSNYLINFIRQTIMEVKLLVSSSHSERSQTIRHCHSVITPVHLLTHLPHSQWHHPGPMALQ